MHKEKDQTRVTLNVLQDFIPPNEEELEERKRLQDRYWNNISEYNTTVNPRPSEEDIRICEKVLKYASQCQYMCFTRADAELVMSSSTNILKWNFGYKILKI